MNLYIVKLRDGRDKTNQYIVANNKVEVLDALKNSMPTVSRDEWSLEDLVSIKSVERNVHICKDE